MHILISHDRVKNVTFTCPGLYVYIQSNIMDDFQRQEHSYSSALKVVRGRGWGEKKKRCTRRNCVLKPPTHCVQNNSEFII